jgi:hypothetical protein
MQLHMAEKTVLCQIYDGWHRLFGYDNWWLNGGGLNWLINDGNKWLWLWWYNNSWICPYN